MADLPYGDESFDVVTVVHGVQYGSDDILRETARVLMSEARRASFRSRVRLLLLWYPGGVMKGHIHKRGHAWELRVYVGVDAVTGKKRFATKSSRGGKRDAQWALVEVAADRHR